MKENHAMSIMMDGCSSERQAAVKNRLQKKLADKRAASSAAAVGPVQIFVERRALQDISNELANGPAPQLKKKAAPQREKDEHMVSGPPSTELNSGSAVHPPTPTPPAIVGGSAAAHAQLCLALALTHPLHPDEELVQPDDGKEASVASRSGGSCPAVQAVAHAASAASSSQARTASSGFASRSQEPDDLICFPCSLKDSYQRVRVEANGRACALCKNKELQGLWGQHAQSQDVITVGDLVRFDGPLDIRKDLGLDGAGRNGITTGTVKEFCTGGTRMCYVLFDMTACLAWVSIEHLTKQAANLGDLPLGCIRIGDLVSEWVQGQGQGEAIAEYTDDNETQGANPEQMQGQGQGIAEYSSDIYNQLLRDEAMFQPFENYFQLQGELNGRMRGILVDWLVQVHGKSGFRPETLHLTINLIDRFLSRISVMRRNLQLVGIVAIFIASKFEEITPSKVADLVYLTNDPYTKEDVFEMECCMLSTLGFQLVVPTAAHFLDRMQLANNSNAAQDQMCRYLVDLCLPDVCTICHAPSHLVAAAALVSNELLERQPAWPEHMVQVTRYSEAQLRPCADEMRTIFEGAATNSLQAVRKRYMLQVHHCVAGMTFPARS